MDPKKKNFFLDFFFDFLGGDFLEMGVTFFDFFLLFVFSILGLTFWAAQYVKHVKIVGYGP